MTDITDTITQEQVNALLKHLQQLYQQIHTTRQELAPIENNLVHAHKEYQAVIGHLQREQYQLQAKIVTLRKLLDVSNQDLETKPDERPGETSDLPDEQIPLHNDEAMAKDQLHEHIYMVLDNENDELLAHLQGMCGDPATKLVDVLEQIPWGSVWISRTRPEETPAEHYQRLATWKQALEKRLDMLKVTQERYQFDHRYGLWQQYQKGPQAWKQFLQQSSLFMQDHNEELNLELQRLINYQAEMGDEHE